MTASEPMSAEAKVVPINRGASPVPSVWVVTGYRAGERVQVMALAEALGWPYQVKDLDYRHVASTLSLFRTRSRLGINRAGSAKLKPPWPDVVISAGMRNEPVCRWIREQSGGKTRYVVDHAIPSNQRMSVIAAVDEAVGLTLGRAEVRQLFRVPRIGVVAGSDMPTASSVCSMLTRSAPGSLASSWPMALRWCGAFTASMSHVPS